jgi:glutamyl-tRNA synthetase
MIHLPEEKLHTRDIKDWIKTGKVSGWDDPRLHTIPALIRRGFRPGAFRLYAIQVGLTKSDIRMNWENLESFNRSIIDPDADRYMVVLDPIKISVKGSPKIPEVTAILHPDFPKRGMKTLPFDGKTIYISMEDMRRFRGKTIRLKNLFNIKLGPKSADYADNEVIQEMPKIQWVSEPNLKLSLLKPDRSLKALAESSLRDLKKGDPLQMERIGYGRIDRKTPLTIIWTHG